MVNEFFIGIFEPLAVMLGIPPALTMYLVIFIFSIGVGISIGSRINNAMGGVIVFVSTLLIFSFLDMFPLYIIAIPILISGVIYFLRGRT